MSDVHVAHIDFYLYTVQFPSSSTESKTRFTFHWQKNAVGPLLNNKIPGVYSFWIENVLTI